MLNYIKKKMIPSLKRGLYSCIVIKRMKYFACCPWILNIVLNFVFRHLFHHRMADIQSGDVVVDPLCGGGSIGIEVCDMML